MMANLVLEHDQALVADMQPPTLKNKLLWKMLLRVLGQLWISLNLLAVQFWSSQSQKHIATTAALTVIISTIFFDQIIFVWLCVKSVQNNSRAC